ncbi:hypothetical protein VPH35_128582 [Triticum aestivum]
MRTFARALQRRDGRRADRGDRQPGPKLGKAKGSRLGWRATGQRAIRCQLQVCHLGSRKGHRCLSAFRPGGRSRGRSMGGREPEPGKIHGRRWYMALPIHVVACAHLSAGQPERRCSAPWDLGWRAASGEEMGILVRSGLGAAVTGETHATGGFLYAHRLTKPRHGIELEFSGETEIDRSKRWRQTWRGAWRRPACPYGDASNEGNPGNIE